MKEYLLNLELFESSKKPNITIVPGEELELKPEHGGGFVKVSGVNFNGGNIDGVVTDRGIYKTSAFKNF